jgi:mRNA interferase RelE/StbE
LNYKIIINKTSSKYLNNLDLKTKEKILQKIKSTKEWLESKSNIMPDIKSMQGEWKGYYRLRVGNYRVIFRVESNSEIRIMFIESIDNRGDIYK